MARNTTKEANLDGRDFNRGRKKADGHSRTIRVPTTQQSRACLITSTAKETGGQSQLFSPTQGKSSDDITARRHELRIKYWNLSIVVRAKQSMEWGPICNPNSKATCPDQHNIWDDRLWDCRHEECAEHRSECRSLSIARKHQLLTTEDVAWGSQVIQFFKHSHYQRKLWLSYASAKQHALE